MKIQTMHFCFAVLVLMCAAVVLAADLPQFRKGMWEYTRVMADPSGKPKTISHSECSNPTEDMKKQNEMLTKSGCKFSPMQQKGSAYTFTADCVMSAGNQKIVSKTTSTITVENDSAYTVKVEGETNNVKTSETLTARRTGDCQ